MRAVFDREHLALPVDQHFGRKPDATSVRVREILRFELPTFGFAASHHLLHDGQHGPWIEDGAYRRFHTEPPVEIFGRIADDRKGHLVGVFVEFLFGRVEDHDLLDVCGADLVMPSDYRLEMDVADRTADEPPE